MKKSINLIFLIFTAIVIFVVTACPPEPSGPPGGNNPDIPLTAQVDGLNVVLTWETVEDLDSFVVYRREEAGDFYEIALINSPGTEFTDDTCPLDTELNYKLEFVLTNSTTFESQESNAVQLTGDAYMTTEVTASTLEFSDRIRVYWAAVSEVDSYKVYRYTSLDATDPAIFDVPSNEYEDDGTGDDPPAAGILYYYRVSCVVDDSEYRVSESYGTGIYTGEVDYFEPNNTPGDAAVVDGAGGTAYLFNYQDGDAQDVDWYTYIGEETDIRIWIALETGSLLSGEIRMEVVNTGASVDITDTPGGVFLDYTEQAVEDLVFMIEFIDFNPEIEVLDSYTMSLQFF